MQGHGYSGVGWLLPLRPKGGRICEWPQGKTLSDSSNVSRYKFNLPLMKGGSLVYLCSAITANQVRTGVGRYSSILQATMKLYLK